MKLSDNPLAGRHYWAALLLVVLVGLGARLLHFHPYLGSDDQRWLIAASEMARGAEPSLHPVYYTRVLWSWVLIIWGEVFALTLESTAVLMFGLAALTIVSVAQCARTLFGERAALLAAIVYATHPIAVTFDTHTLPDGLAVAMLAASMLFFARYLGGGRLPWLAAAGVLAGLLYSAKSYFALVGLPMAAVLALPFGNRLGLRHIVTLVGAVLSGVLCNGLLSVAASVDTFNVFGTLGEYAQRLSVPRPNAYEGWKAVVDTLTDRLAYLRSLYFGYGGAVGLVMLWATFLLLVKTLDGRKYVFLLLVVVSFLLFLIAMPASISPLVLVEVQDRYLMVVLPALSVAAGQALLLALNGLQTLGLRYAALGLLVCVSVFNLTVPSNLLDRYNLLEIEGLRASLDVAAHQGIEEVVVPRDFRERMPDSYFRRGVAIRFVDFEHMISPASPSPSLGSRSAVFIPRDAYRRLQDPLRTGDYNAITERGRHAALVDDLTAIGFKPSPIRVPYDTPRVWLERLGVSTRGQLVAWILIRPQ